MSIVAARCPQCGAALQVEEKSDAGICSFCGTPFITEKAINNYIVNKNNIYNIQNANFTIQAPKEESKVMVYGLSQSVIGGTLRVYWNNELVGKLQKGGLLEIPVKKDGVLAVACGINPLKGKVTIHAGRTTKVQIVYNQVTGGFIPKIVDIVT